MFFIVQSPERDPSYLTERSLEFLKGFRQQLVDLPASKLRYTSNQRLRRFLFLFCFVLKKSADTRI